MKILYYNQAINATEGAAIHAKELYYAFVEMGHEVICYPEPKESIYAKERILVRNTGRWSEYFKESLRLIRGIINSIKDFWILRKEIKNEKIDFLLTRNFEFSLAALLVQIFTKIPVVVEINALLFKERKKYGDSLFILIRKYIEKLSIESVSGVYVVSEELIHILDEESITPQKICVVENGVNLRLFDKNKKITLVLQGYRKKGVKIIGFVGSLKSWHGIELLIESFHEVQKKFPETLLVIIGDGEMKEVLRKKTYQLGLQQNIMFTGSVPHSEIPYYINGFDIATAPYLSGTSFYFSPLKLYEYMAMAKPVVCANLGQMNALIQNDYDGCLVKPDDSAALSDALEGLLRYDDKRKAIGRNGFIKVSNNFTWINSAEKIISFFKKIKIEN